MHPGIQGRRITMAKKEVPVANRVTSEAIREAHEALMSIMEKHFQDLDFDFDMFIANIVYWYEFQGFAKAYGKKLIYFTPKKKEDK